MNLINRLTYTVQNTILNKIKYLSFSINNNNLNVNNNKYRVNSLVSGENRIKWLNTGRSHKVHYRTGSLNYLLRSNITKYGFTVNG